MRTNTIVLAFVLSLVAGVGAAMNEAFSPVMQSTGSQMGQMGTWKLNEAKSKLDPGAAKNTNVVYISSGDNVKVTVDGTDSAGNSLHTEWTGKFDGKPYPLKGNPASDTRAYTAVDDHTLSFVEKKGAAVTISGRISVAADGKSRTVDATATDSKGMKVNTHAVYDKQ
jgi:hypothetical protein